MSNAIQELEDRVADLKKEIDEFKPKEFETPDLLKSRYEGLIRQREKANAEYTEACKQAATSK